MITVHHLENSRSQRVLWLLEELGLPYDIKRYERNKKTMLAPPELQQVHPLGKSPVITDGDITIAETGAIVEHLIDQAKGALRPKAGTDAHRRYRYWLHFAEGSAMPPLLMALIFSKVRTAPMPFFAKPIAHGIADKVMSSFVQPNLDRNLAFIESELARGPWFAGAELSGADVMMIFPAEGALARSGRDAASRAPHLKDFVDRVHARPAWKKALERGGPYELMR